VTARALAAEAARRILAELAGDGVSRGTADEAEAAARAVWRAAGYDDETPWAEVAPDIDLTCDVLQRAAEMAHGRRVADWDSLTADLALIATWGDP
jgi:hypothetical protein